MVAVEVDGPNSEATPRWVAMVRSASSVTSTRQWPVTAAGDRRGGGRLEGHPDGPDVVGEGLAQGSSATRPMKAARPPRAATPATVLAADPPEASTVGPMVA